MRTIFRFSLFFFAIFLFSNLKVSACSCITPGAPCQAMWNSEAVFSGQVTAVEETQGTLNSTTSEFRQIRFPQNKISFIVDETFRGAARQTVEVTTGKGGGDCGYNFEKGRKYLIYAYKNPETGELGTGICSRTRPLENASEDIAYFRSLASAKSGARISGIIYQRFVRRNDDPYKAAQPLPDITVIAENNDGKFEAKTDDTGKYSFADLAAGEYKISLLKPKNLWGYEESRKVKVADKGCADVSIYLETKTILSGKVTDNDGLPFAEKSVDLIPVEQLNSGKITDRPFASTDKNGDFIFRSIPTGRYYLGIRLSGFSDLDFPYPQTFYPGTTDKEEAAIITITEGDAFENYNFLLPKKLSKRRIEGKVTMPDGKPAAGASLTVNEAKSFSFFGAGEVKANGTFSFELVDGVKYVVKPYVTINGKQFHAEPLEIPAAGAVKNLNFVITEPNGNCEKCRIPKKFSPPK